MILRFSGWDECDHSTYSTCCENYGFNSESNPQYIDFMMKHGANLQFFAYRKGNKLLGSACVDKGWLINDHKNPNREMSTLLMPAHSIVLPLSPEARCIVPFKTKSLSPLTSGIKNSSFNIFSKRKIALAKNCSDFSKKTRETRKREIKRFINSGGSFKRTNEISSSVLFNIYEYLMIKRRGNRIENRNINLDFLDTFKENFIGNVLFLNHEPVGIQLLLSTTSRLGVFIDFINIGYDLDIKKHPLGTIAMWSNLNIAESLAAEKKLPLHYSYGAMSGEYKKRWCTPMNVGRTLMLQL